MCDIIVVERSKMQSDELKISTKGQINDSKLSQDDYEANLLLVRKAVESMRVAYDCISDIKTGLSHETNKCWRRRVLELLGEANNMMVFSVDVGLIGMPETEKATIPTRMLGNSKVSLTSMGGLVISNDNEEDYPEWLEEV